MNWKFTRPNQRVHFEVDEPFCHLFPLQRGSLASVTPMVRKLSDDSDLEQEFRNWSESRNVFNVDLGNPTSKAAQDKWQKGYFKGMNPSGTPAPEGHRSRLRLQPFKPV